MPDLSYFLMPANDLNRRRFLGGGAAVVGAALLAACTRGSESADSGGETSTITNEFGTYDVPVRPQRIVLLENRVELEVATALGLTPYAVGDFYTFVGGPAEWVAPWVPFAPTGEEKRFKSFEIAPEQLLALEPDLILSDAHWLKSTDTPGRSYQEVSAAGPVVPIGLAGTWQANLEQVAGWLGREDELAKLMDEFNTLRDSIKSKHGPKIAEATVTFGSGEDPYLWLANENASRLPAATALKELGGKPLPFDDPAAQEEGWLEVAEERVDLLNGADAALFWAPDADARDRLVTSPLWSGVEIVKNGNVVVTEQNIGSGQVFTIMEAMRRWDDVYSTLD